MGPKKNPAAELEEATKAAIDGAVEDGLAKSQKIVALSTDVNEMKGNVGQLNDNVGALTGNVDEVKGNVASIQDELVELTRMMKELLKPKPEPEPDNPDNPTPPGPTGPKKQQPRVNPAFKPEELTLDFTLAAFKTWKSRFRDYYRMNVMGDLPPENQAAHLRSCISMKTQDHLRIFMSMGADARYDEILDMLEEYFTGQSNVTSRRVEFSTCKQKQGESFEEFFVRLSLLQEDSDPCQHCQEEQLVTRVIAGIGDSELRQKLLRLRDPKVAEVKELCKAWELSRKDDKQLGDRGRQNKVSTYKQGQKYGGKKRDESRGRSPSPGRKSCPGCHSRHSRKNCPHLSATCNSCGMRGHIQTVCMSKGGNAGKSKPAGNNSSGNNGGPSKSNAVRVCAFQDAAPTIHVQAECQGKRFSIDALADSGADDSIIGLKNLKRAGPFQVTKGVTRKLIAANDSEMRCLGTVKLRVTFYGRTVSIQAYVATDVEGFLLSWRTSKELGLLSPNYPLPYHVMDDVPKVSQVKSDEPSLEGIKKVKAGLMEEFSDVFYPSEEFLPPMEGPPMSIKLVDGYKPSRVTAVRPIAFAYRDKVKEVLDKLVKDGLIKPAGDENTEWCSPMHIVPKKNGDPRVVIDYTLVNKFVQRPVHPFQSPRDAVADIPAEARWFTTMDAKSGYWQILLDEEAQRICTFLTPFGRYMPLRGPMGLVSTGDEYCRRGDTAFQGIESSRKIVDDTLLYSKSFREHVDHVRSVLERCRKHKITMNPDKFSFGQEKVEFCGFEVGRDGIRADPNKVKAIQSFPKPTNLTDLRSFFGLVNQLGDFTSELSGAAEALRPLLRTKNAFQWLPEHDEAFDKVRAALASPPVLASFDPKLPTVLRTDASRLKGLGYAMLQEHSEGDKKQFRLVQCGSRFITETESRYSMVELELLAVVWATDKCKLYLQGMQLFSVETDHKPLIPILNQYQLQAIQTPRLQRLREKLVPYSFHATHVPGKDNVVADALSRAPVEKAEDDAGMADEDPTQASLYRRARAIELDEDSDAGRAPRGISDQGPRDKLIEGLIQDGREDAEYAKLKQAVQGEVDFKDPAVAPYKKLMNELSICDDLVLHGARIIVPKNSRKGVLQKLHVPHQGIDRSKMRARQLFYWPGIGADIKSQVEACEQCQRYQASQQREEQVSLAKPTRPFEMASADFFTYNSQDFLVYADRYSGWSIVVQFRTSPTSASLIKEMVKIFRDTGVPVELASDGGLQFTSAEFRQFCDEWGIEQRISSPHYPQSNGHAEAAVKAMKTMIKKYSEGGKFDDLGFQEAVLEWRNTPHKRDGRSPAQMIFGRPMRTRLPSHSFAFKPEFQESARECDLRAALKFRENPLT